jgi:hypothetical protein
LTHVYQQQRERDASSPKISYAPPSIAVQSHAWYLSSPTMYGPLLAAAAVMEVSQDPYLDSTPRYPAQRQCPTSKYSNLPTATKTPISSILIPPTHPCHLHRFAFVELVGLMLRLCGRGGLGWVGAEVGELLVRREGWRWLQGVIGGAEGEPVVISVRLLPPSHLHSGSTSTKIYSRSRWTYLCLTRVRG